MQSPDQPDDERRGEPWQWSLGAILVLTTLIAFAIAGAKQGGFMAAAACLIAGVFAVIGATLLGIAISLRNRGWMFTVQLAICLLIYSGYLILTILAKLSAPDY